MANTIPHNSPGPNSRLQPINDTSHHQFSQSHFPSSNQAAQKPRWSRRKRQWRRRKGANPNPATSFDAASEVAHLAQPSSVSIHNSHPPPSPRRVDDTEEPLETKVRALLTSSLKSSPVKTAEPDNPTPDVIMAPMQTQDGFVPPHMRMRQAGSSAAPAEGVPPHMQRRTVDPVASNGESANVWDSARPDPSRKPPAAAGETLEPTTSASPDIRAVNGNLPRDTSPHNKDSLQNEGLGGDLVDALRRSLENSDSTIPKSAAKVPDELSVATQRSPATGNTARNGRQRRGKKSAWIKNRDLPKPPPTKPDSNSWGSDEGGEDNVDSVIADNGWGKATKRDHYDQDYKLQDWDGNWAPAPVDWEERGCFKDRAWGERIHNWLGDSAIFPHGVINVHLEGLCSEAAGDLAPKAWIPEHIDGIPVYEWWVHHLKSPLYDGPPDAKPWWHRYRSAKSQLLTPLYVPDTKGPNPNAESHKEQSRRLEDAGSDEFSQKYLHKIAKKQEERRQERKQAAREREEARKREEERRRNPKPFFLRAVLATDIHSVTGIYNKHVQHTVHCPEDHPITGKDMSARMDAIRRADLPFIVAVGRPKDCSDNKGHKLQRNNTTGDKILGFAYAKEYKEGSDIFRHTFVLEIFVDPSHYKKQVGDVLMERMHVSLASKCYFPKTDYEFFGAGKPYDCGGPPQVCGYIIVQMQYAADDSERFEWMSKWLRKWEFGQVGIHKAIGIKQGKELSVALFQKKTGECIDP